MTPATSVSFFNAEFNEFLYSPIDSEKNGMPLSVLSALARLDLDPWEEAAQLSELPKDTAARRLASLIARVPAGPRTLADCQTIAVRLIEFLPRRSSPHASSISTGAARGSRKIKLPAIPVMVAIALGVAVLLITMSREPSSPADHDVPFLSSRSPPQSR
jgi:hypothetical protein